MRLSMYEKILSILSKMHGDSQTYQNYWQSQQNYLKNQNSEGLGWFLTLTHLHWHDILKKLWLRSTKICSSCSTCIKTLELRATTRGKTSKTAVLPGFCKIERGGGSSTHCTVVVLPAKNLQWWPWLVASNECQKYIQSVLALGLLVLGKIRISQKSH